MLFKTNNSSFSQKNQSPVKKNIKYIYYSITWSAYANLSFLIYKDYIVWHGNSSIKKIQYYPMDYFTSIAVTLWSSKPFPKP